MVAQILDRYYLGLTAFITLGIQASAFLVAYTLQIDTITDFSGGSNFFILALVTLLCSGTYHARQIVASVFVMLWAARLGGFLLFRVIRTGSDHRFDEMRSHFFRFAGFWVFQFLWVWTVSLPVTFLNSPAVSAPANNPYPSANPDFGSGTDVVGVIFFVVGFVLEALADVQKWTFKSSNPPKDAVCDKGVWGWSRRVNYFGELAVWWGIWMVCLQPAITPTVPAASRKALYASVLGPIFITVLLLFLSGLPTAEKPTQQRAYLKSHGPKASEETRDAWRKMERYKATTSILLPLPPAVYARLPRWLKTTVLLDWPIYNFDPAKDGKKAIEEEEAKQREDA